MLEEARRNKLMGSSLEARVRLSVEQPALAESLVRWNALPNGCDPLRYNFIVSQVRSQTTVLQCWAACCRPSSCACDLTVHPNERRGC